MGSGLGFGELGSGLGLGELGSGLRSRGIVRLWAYQL